MANDWRVTVTLRDPAHVGRELQSLREHEVSDDVRRRLGDRIAVSAEGSRVLLYAGTENAAREAERIVRELTAQRGLAADFAVDRWHPVEEEWETSEAAMPQTPEERQAEHQRLEAEETRQSLSTGLAEWEVRIELPSHHAALELAERLRSEGRSVIRRWTLLVLGTNDEDDASALAQVVRQEAPAGTTVQTQQVGPLLPFTQIGPIPVW